MKLHDRLWADECIGGGGGGGRGVSSPLDLLPTSSLLLLLVGELNSVMIACDYFFIFYFFIYCFFIIYSIF